MNFVTKQNEKSLCPREEIISYIDGELSPHEELDLDIHISKCKVCSAELNAQKKVSSTLEILLKEEPTDIKLPQNFTKVVTAKAESDVRGLRHPKERPLAFFISAVLVLLIIIGFGTDIETIIFAANKFAGQFLAVSGFIWHIFYDVAVGIAVILRSLSHHYVYGSAITLFLILAFFASTALALSRMVLRFDRT